jgi:CRISPR-associated protein Csb1
MVRFTDDLGPELWGAFRALVDRGDAEPLARIAPTSLVFGVWDSRATQAKVPRIVRSVIRAYNVREFHRSAQYSTIAGEILEGGDAEVTTKGPKAELGLAHVPAAFTHGGIQVLGELRRDVAMSLVALRTLRATSNGDDLKLRRYILGLALVSFTAPPEVILRQGCEIVPDPNKPPQTQLVEISGGRDEFQLSHESALDYAGAAAKEFGIREQVVGHFSAEVAQELLKLPEKDRKAVLKSGPVTTESLKKRKAKAGKKPDQTSSAEPQTAPPAAPQP